MVEDNNDTQQIGKKFREIRTSKNITLNEISNKTGLTASFISQFERGLTTSSIASIQKIAQILNTPLASLFEDYSNSNQINNISIVRKQERKRILFPAPASTKDYSLTDVEGKLQVLYSTIEPGGNSGDLYKHEGEEECILILAGTMKISIENQSYTLYEGDTIKFSSRSPHGWENIGQTKLEALWIITPPSF